MEEIKAGDIMLGNWFHVNGYPMYVDSIFRDTVYLEFEGNEGDVWEENIKDLKPIPLTEDILLKAGFRKRKMSGYDTHFIYSLFIGGETIGITAIYNADFSIMLHGVARGVKYLHRLQNIIKIITVNELEINL